MDAQDFRSLQEAYMEVVENQQQLDEAKEDEGLTPLQKIRKRNKKYALPGEPAGQQTSNRRAERSSTRGVKKEKGAKSAFGTMRHVGGPYKEEVDLYDIILSHLLDEGYAETPEAAEAIMVNMSEEWRDEIVEEFVDPEQGEAPSGRSPLENVANHPSKKVRKKAISGFRKQMSNEYGGNWKSKSNDGR